MADAVAPTSDDPARRLLNTLGLNITDYDALDAFTIDPGLADAVIDRAMKLEVVESYLTYGHLGTRGGYPNVALWCEETMTVVSSEGGGELETTDYLADDLVAWFDRAWTFAIDAARAGEEWASLSDALLEAS